MIKGFSVELFDPRRDPEPRGWTEYHQAAGLNAAWSYDVLRGLSEETWSPMLLGLFADEAGPCGVLGGVYLGLRRAGRPRPRREPLVLDVRLPGASHGPAWHFAERVSVERRRGMLRAFERAAVRRLGWGCAGVVYRNLTDSGLPLVARRGSPAWPSSPATTLRVTWSSVDEWLGSLRKGRRTDVRRQVRIVDASTDLDVEVRSGRDDLDPAVLAALSRAHAARLRSRFDPRAPLTTGYFAAMCRRPDVFIVSYRERTRDGRLLAFGTLIDHPTSPWLGPWASRTPEEGGRKHLYFDHYVRLMRQVVGSGRTELSSGQGMAEIKQSLGFGLVPMHSLAVPRVLAGR